MPIPMSLLAHRALDPPPSSSLAEERTPPLAPHSVRRRAIPTQPAEDLTLR
jgi:hypothetical protein